MLLVPKLPPPEEILLVSQFRPFSTVFLYLVPNLCVSPAARKGKSAKPVAATLSLLEPSNSHEPSLSCFLASQARPRATAASERGLPPRSRRSLSFVAPLILPSIPGDTNGPEPAPGPCGLIPLLSSVGAPFGVKSCPNP